MNIEITKEELKTIINLGEKHLNTLKKELARLDDPKPWPQEGDDYEFILDNGDICGDGWKAGYKPDDMRFATNNIFKPGTAKDSLVYKIRHSDYEYWIAGLSDIEKLGDKHNDMEYFNVGTGNWKPVVSPTMSTVESFRWPK